MNVCVVRTLTQEARGYTPAWLLIQAPLPHEPELLDGQTSEVVSDEHAVSLCKHCAVLYVHEKSPGAPEE